MNTFEKENKVRESMDSPKKIDLNVKFKIPRSPQLYNETRHKYKCTCCGKGFTNQNGNFQKTNSPLFQSNDGYLPWCKECADKYYAILCAFYSNNEEHAIQHYCQQADWVYEINPLVASMDNAASKNERTRLAHYSAKKNINCNGRKTYTDSLMYDFALNHDNTIYSKEQAKTDELNVSNSAIDRWGIGLKEIDYRNLDEHYRMLKRNNPNADNNQDIFIKALANINNLMIKASIAGDANEYVKLVEQYNKTFSKAGLRTVEEKDASNNESFCMTLGFISEYTPEEFYKDKNLYKDFDGLGDYADRHITRPLMNIIKDTDIRDKEFYVPDGDEYEE